MSGVEHRFSLRAEWTGNRGTGTSGPKDFARDVVIQAEDPGEILGSAAAAFHGDYRRWNPEQLLLGALAECHILSYLFVAMSAGVSVTQMSCRAELTLTHTAEGGQVSAATLRPEVWVEDDTVSQERLDSFHDEAHRQCFIARSVNFPVTIEPQRRRPAEGTKLPDFSSRLGAPIAVLRPRPAKRPSQVTGLENRPGVSASAPAAPFQRTESAPAKPAQDSPSARPSSFYEQIGGRPTFAQLCKVFYEGVAEDPILREMYPEEDLGPAEERLLLFLEQYWGGPTTYSEQRGHPRLRMRHQPYRVDFDARDRWLKHMRVAVESLGLPPLQEETLWDYLERAAHAMVNA